MKRILFLVVLLSPLPALAVSISQYGFECGFPFIGCSFVGSSPGSAALQLARTVVIAVRAFVLTVAFIATVYGGYRIIAARGNSEGVEAGKKAIMWAVFGFIFVTLAQPIVLFVIDFIATVGG